MKTSYKITLLSLVAILQSCGEPERKAITDQSAPIKVQVSDVSPNDLTSFISASGTIEAVNSANLSTRTMGYVQRIYVKVGDRVNKGQLLLSVNSTDLQAKRAQVNAAITEATAAFNNAEKDYNRFKNLFTNNSASQKELDDMTAHYNMAKARLEGAKQMLNEVEAQFSYSNIKAPFNGVITSKFVEEGTMANPGMPLLSLETPGRFEVMTMVPENEITEIKQGTVVEVLVKSLNRTIKGRVSEVSASAKNTGGQYLVKVDLEKTDAQLRSGMFTSVQFPIEQPVKSTMVLIPKEAIITNGQLSGVYTISSNNTALLRWLRLGRSYGEKVEVLSGLSSDETYIVSADGKLYNGAKIAIQ